MGEDQFWRIYARVSNGISAAAAIARTPHTHTSTTRHEEFDVSLISAIQGRQEDHLTEELICQSSLPWPGLDTVPTLHSMRKVSCQFPRRPGVCPCDY